MRLALIVQRYGPQVIGGSETLARQLAERLAPRHEVTVLTTCALDYRDWANVFADETTHTQGVTVKRFPVERRRNWRSFGRRSQLLFSARTRWNSSALLRQYRWVIKQGPECPALLEFLRSNRSRFDLFLFLTYLYYPTFFGLPEVAEKALLIPTAHEEPPIHLPIYRPLFHLPRALIFNTPEEQNLVHSLFDNDYILSRVIGTGIELHPPSQVDLGYFLYAGRIEHGKNCEELFQFARSSGIQLRLIGPSQIRVPEDVEYLGIVSEDEKQELFRNARAIIAPSLKESLSLAVLEAWSHAKPVIVSSRSPVLKGQVERSGGGYVYGGQADFKRIVENIDPCVGEKGHAYLEQHYAWPSILPRYEEVFSEVLGAREK